MSLLDQRVSFTAGTTVGGFLFSDDHPKISLLRAYHECIAACSRQEKGSQTQLHRLMDDMDRMGSWEVETSYASLLSELNGPALDQSMDILSGGMRKKAALARALASKPQFLLLDEPTNHLDIPTIEWLENHLVASDATMIIVTHDRYVLNRLCTAILEIDNGRCYSYPGSYTAFLERRTERLADLQNEQDRLRTVLRHELEWLKKGPRARTGKDSGRKQRIESMRGALTANTAETTAFISCERRMGKKILELLDVRKSYEGKIVVSSFSHGFTKGERIGMIGPNGSGKTTLLDLISGRVDADSGRIDVGVNTVFGYYDQLDSGIDTTKTVLEHVQDIAEQVTLSPGQAVSASRFLELFGFPVSFHRISIGMLSGGERRRLHLISILMRNPNFLLLDEPTNDLDIDTMRRLEEYILDFSGCALIVSHDRAFLDRTTDHLFVFDGCGGIQEFPGTFSDYHDHLASASEVAREAPVKHALPHSVPQRERKGLSFKEKREYETILDEIGLLEQEMLSLEQGFSAAGSDPLTLPLRTERYKDIRSHIEQKMDRWEDLASRAE